MISDNGYSRNLSARFLKMCFYTYLAAVSATIVILGASLVVKMPSPAVLFTLFSPHIQMQSTTAAALLQAMVAAQVSLLAILFSAIFVISQLTSNRYALDFGSVILKLKYVRFTLILGSISAIVDAAGFLLIGAYAEEELLLFSIIVVLLGTTLILSLYPLVQSILAKITPLGVLDLYTQEITPSKYVSQSYNYMTDRGSANHPLDSIYVFIRSALERGETTIAIKAVRELYSVAENAYNMTEYSGDNSKWLKVDAKNVPYPAHPYNYTLGEYFRICVLFDLLLNDYSTSLVDYSVKHELEDVSSTVIEQMERFFNIAIAHRDPELLMLCTIAVFDNIFKKIGGGRSSTEQAIFEQSAQCISSVFWESFSKLRIVNIPVRFRDHLDEEREEVIFDPFSVSGGHMHESLAGAFRITASDVFESLESQEAASNDTIQRIFSECVDSFKQNWESNMEVYSQMPIELFLCDSLYDWTPAVKDDWPGDPASLKEIEQREQLKTVVWPLAHIQNNLLWLTDSYFQHTGYPDEVHINRGVVGVWLDMMVYSLNECDESFAEDVGKICLLLIAVLKIDIMDGQSTAFDGNFEGDMNTYEGDYESLKSQIPEEISEKIGSLEGYRLMLILNVLYIYTECGEEITDKLIDELVDDQWPVALERYKEKFSEKSIWKQVSNYRNTDPLDRELQYLKEIGDSPEEFEASKLVTDSRLYHQMGAMNYEDRVV